MSLIKFDEVTSILGRGDTQTVALNNVTIEIENHEIVSIIGESGSGKSTILNVLSGLVGVNSGNVYVADNKINIMKKRQQAEYRRKFIGFVYQNSNLISSLSVRDNICLPLLMNGQKIELSWLNEIIEQLNIKDIINKKPFQLSGGQAQRVAIARAIIHKPTIVLADEPTGNLDSFNSDAVFELLFKCALEYKQKNVCSEYIEARRKL
jgi:putative ABC transport system ATP-binding protein